MKKTLPILFLLLSFNLFSQSYSELSSAGLENKSLGSIATGDLNNDGYLDAITTGIDESSELSTSVYINDQDGSFTKLNVSLTPLYNATIALGDYNNDGFLDVLLAGEGYDPLASLWKNNGDLTFTEVEAGLTNLGGTNAEFGDVDNDGDLDLLLSGSIKNENGSYSSDLRLYSNEGNDSFIEFDLSFTSYSVVGTLGDFDNDGDLDLLSGGGSLEIYPNNGDGTFSPPQNYGSFPAGQMKWFDFDNDGDLDFIISGRGSGADEYFTKIYQNVGAENNWFVELQDTDFANPSRGKLDIRDYNSDGYLDLLITGTLDFSTNSFVTKIYDNSGTTFSENSTISLPQLGSGDGNWFDIDNDGDLDLLLTGEEDQGSNVKKTVVYRNDENGNTYSTNSTPNAPSELSWTWTNEVTSFSWGAGSDNETPTLELSYNLGVGTTTEASNILFPESNSDGSRLVQKLGNAQNNTEKLLANLEDGIFYFKVQSIDGSLAGSEFSEAEKFAVGIPASPSSAQAAINSDDDIEITWTDNSVNEFSFVIEQKSNLNADYVEVGTVETDVNSISISGLVDGIYTFRIKAINPNGESEYIETNDVAVGIPAAPSDAQAAINTDDIEITWTDNSVNEFSFVIEQKSNLNADYVEVGTVETDVNSISISGLDDAIYTFRIKAINPNGESEYIETNDVAVGIPTAPSDAQAVVNTDDDIEITWTDNSVNEFSFVIEQKSNLNADYAEVESVETDENSISISGLDNAIYTFRIKAINPNGESEYIETNDVAFGIPAAPSNFSATLNNDRSVLLAWDDLVNERTYKLERTSNNGDSYVEIAILEMDIQEYLDENLIPGTYSYRIQSINENGESDFVNSDLSIEIVLGISDSNKSNLSIYPNPVFDDFVYVKTPDNHLLYDIQISDLTGKTLNPPITHFNDSWRIDFAGIQSGVYIVNAKKGNEILSQRVIIE
ncbi:Por secretion system C-terminal sorting domain-containing protein [Ekhidna lutea]|uniref:Por secretion system C-terminal sorting domain-containing protein n=1 Tax=Ekhidna lutea TaxID=447679 RepID=A0A239LF57_EKHLU|nr:FG-GAP-like repeat-containing protein [Ekhidna lutea]SNT28154.1 Por secretion system C-terminal sorting domain-containing protein [Ekhidna lutea]